MAPRTLAELEAAVARDLALIAHPRQAWLTPKTVAGRAALDVLIVGAGQGGLAVAFGLRRARVDNILVVDREPMGREGPWSTFARMPTLRSPKDQTGPDLDVPSLTYQSWHEAQWGADDFTAMRLIPTARWAEYLLWYRRVLDLPVRNETTATDVAPALADDGSPCLAIRLEGAEGGETVHARKVVLATGQDGTGRWWMPDFVEALPSALRAHTCEDIDFDALRGKIVAVLGAGASAFDNAATALEAGAGEVHLFCRRAEPMVVQPYRWLTFAGFLRHLGDMPDEWRWRFMSRILGMREGFPADTWARVAAFPNFRMHVGRPWTGAAVADGRLAIETVQGPFAADFAICGTGMDNDFGLRPELARAADNIATWSDRYAPPDDERNERLGRFPYVGPDYAFTEKKPGLTPWIADIHLFAIGTTMSFGPSGSSLNAMTTAVPRLVAGVTRGLFAGDIALHWRSLQAYDVPQVVLDADRIVGAAPIGATHGARAELIGESPGDHLSAIAGAKSEKG